jgi:hypothetical protein
MVRTIFTAALLLLCSAFSATATTVTLAWDPNPEPDVTGYIVMYGTSSGQYTGTVDTGIQTSYQFTLPDSTTRYYFAVCAYNAAGIRSVPSPEVSTVGATLVVTGLTSSVPAPQQVGASVTFTVTSTGGVSPPQYKWLVFDGATWTTAQSWSTSTTFAWRPATANPNYQISVGARNAASTTDAADNPLATATVAFPISAASQPLTLTDLHADLASPQTAGTSITFTAAATGGVGPYQYKWLIFNGATWSAAQNWSASNTFVWTPTVASTSSAVGVWVRSATSTADAPDNAGAGSTMQFVITELVSVSIAANKSAPQPDGSKIQFTAAVNNTGAYMYKWWVFDGTAWVIAQEWSSGNKFNWTPTVVNPNAQVLVRVQQVSTPAKTGGTSMPFPIVAGTSPSNGKGNGGRGN